MTTDRGVVSDPQPAPPRVSDPVDNPRELRDVIAEALHGFNSHGECECGYPTERNPQTMRQHQAAVVLGALDAAGWVHSSQLEQVGWVGLRSLIERFEFLDEELVDTNGWEPVFRLSAGRAAVGEPEGSGE